MAAKLENDSGETKNSQVIMIEKGCNWVAAILIILKIYQLI